MYMGDDNIFIIVVFWGLKKIKQYIIPSAYNSAWHIVVA